MTRYDRSYVIMTNPSAEVRSYECLQIFHQLSPVNLEKADSLSCNLLITEEHEDIRVMLSIPKCLFVLATCNCTCTHLC